jgi:hypothetical protein
MSEILLNVSFSDKTGATLVKHVQKQLVPADDTMGDGNPASPSPAMTLLPPSVIEAAITTVATRVNYGLDNPLTGGRVPAAFCVWRWEVKPERRDWLPKSVKDKVEARILERTQVGTAAMATVMESQRCHRQRRTWLLYSIPFLKTRRTRS